MAELCREFGISRKTGYKIFDRYQQCGTHGLTDTSRRPYPYANQPSVFSSEVDRENILVVIRPCSEMLLTLGHQNFLQAQSSDPTLPFLRASVQIQSSFDVAQFRFGAGFFQFSSQMRNNLAGDFSASRRITNSLDIGVNYFRTLSGLNPSGNVSMSIREVLSPRISLLQVVDYSQGHVNVLYGGSYLSNRFTISVDYQTLYSPFATNPFSQGINIGLRIRLGNLQINAQAFRSADGRLHYTAFADSLMTTNFRLLGAHEESHFGSRIIARRERQRLEGAWWMCDGKETHGLQRRARSSYQKNTKALFARYSEYRNYFRRTYVADLTFGDGMPILHELVPTEETGSSTYLSESLST